MINPHAAKEIIGQLDTGQSVYRLQLKGGGLTANILTWGAVLQDLRLDGHDAPLVLGFDEFEPYLEHSPYFGATVGRYANRIGNGRFKLDGVDHSTDINGAGKHTLHGGSAGYGRRQWEIADLGTSHVYLTLRDEAGTMGFPGNCDVTCSYTLKEEGTLHVAYTVRSDAPTPAGLAHHSYFTLDGSPDCRNHEMQILADHYLPVDEELIPTGEIASVEGTVFDFRQAKTIGDDFDENTILDHNFCLARSRRGLQDIANVYCPNSSVSLTVASSEPGLQVYAGHKVNTPVAGLAGETYGAFAGFCMETQNWPDAPNQPDFPDSIVRPDQELRQITEYRFSKSGHQVST
ncbi:MAG: aldose epimerase family protein [Rhizobiaceae bacterium]